MAVSVSPAWMILSVIVRLPLTSKAVVGVAVLIPTRSFVVSIFMGDPLPSNVSRLSKSVLIFVPQVSWDAPTSGFTSPKFVVVVSAMFCPHAARVQVLLDGFSVVQFSLCAACGDQSAPSVACGDHASDVAPCAVQSSACGVVPSHFKMALADTIAETLAVALVKKTRTTFAVAALWAEALALSSYTASARAVAALVAVVAALGCWMRCAAPVAALVAVVVALGCWMRCAAPVAALVAVAAAAALISVTTAPVAALAALALAAASLTRRAAAAVALVVADVADTSLTRAAATVTALVAVDAAAASVIEPSRP